VSFSSLCDVVLETLKVQQEPRTVAAIAREARPSGCLSLAEPQASERAVAEALRNLEQLGLARRLRGGDDLWEWSR
jgi:hypothetical protein